MHPLAMTKLVLLLSGVLLHLVDVHAVSPSASPNAVVPTTNTTTQASNTTLHTTTQAPNTTAHTTTQAPNTTVNTTTQAPNTTVHTTTHAPNTTAHVTNTTTHAPNTTAHVTNTTTHAPNTTAHVTNTTTHGPNTTTPHMSTTVPTPTLQPKPSPPETGNYSVKSEKETCIIALMGLELELSNSTKTKQYFNIVPKGTKATGQCESSKANLNLTFSEGFINFLFVKDANYYHIEEITANFIQSSSVKWYGTVSKETLLTTNNGYHVKCTNTPDVHLSDNMTLVMANVDLQAFDIKDGVFGKATSCSYDRNVCLAVGLTVVILIIIGLVAYLIYHKKKSSGYQRI
ncbi:lysosome-associated membrane glycoprotein 3 isoform 2-T2 [Discoglossus pictus]